MKSAQEIISKSLQKKSLFKKSSTNTYMLQNTEFEELKILLPDSIKNTLFLYVISAQNCYLLLIIHTL